MRRNDLAYVVFLCVIWGVTLVLFVGYFFLGWFQ